MKAYVEATEIVHGRFSIVDVIVNDESCAFRVLFVPFADLTDAAELAEDVVHVVGGNLVQFTKENITFAQEDQ